MMDIQVRNPVWGDADQTSIFMEVIVPWIPDEWIPFIATVDYDQAYGRELFAAAKNGYFGEIGPYVAPETVPSVPQAVSALQGLLAIDFFGLAESFDAWAKSPDRTFAERAFIDKAQTWKRNDQTVLNAAGVLGLSDDQLDQMFIKAAEF